MQNEDIRLAGDREIADLLSLSQAWVRTQRYKRRHGLPHVFNIDPVLIGSVPRYRIDEVNNWIKGLIPANDNDENISKGNQKGIRT